MDTEGKATIQHLDNVRIITKEMAYRVVKERKDDPKCSGIIVLSLDDAGGFHSTITDGCYSKLFNTSGILGYVKSIFEAEARELNGHN